MQHIILPETKLNKLVNT